MKVPAGQPLIDAITLAYAARRPVLLEGPPGVGKSELMVQAAAALHIRCIVRDLSMMEPVDLSGLPLVNHNAKTMTFAPPEFLPRDGSGLLFFEELNRCGHHMMAPTLQLLTARCLNDYNLPDGWLPVAAINPANLEGIQAEELDIALRSRFCVIEVVADVKEWLAWAEKSAVHKAIIRFVRDTPNIFEVKQSSPRSWKYVSDMLCAAERTKATTQTLLINVSGLVGPDLAAGAMAYRDLGGIDVPDATVVIHDYATVRQAVQNMVKAMNTAFINALVHKLRIYLQAPIQEAQVQNNKRQLKNLRQAIGDLPAEFRAQIASAHPWTKVSA